MSVKKEVVENLKTYFQFELKAMNYEILKNKNEIKRLVEKQALLKRSRAKLDQLSRETVLILYLTFRLLISVRS